ncbi:MAG: endonuclease/exonuclease/phosphatase [Saprospiraceae bacterium]|nr:endonuclease/exonuclease/phosphatase [Saprospiraceae bacterium]
MKTYFVAFWNLENLFDIENSPRRSEKLQRAIGQDLARWGENQLALKISQLASIIKLMNNGLGPDILGVCEIENKHVLERLVAALATLNRNYAIAHADTNDQRGIDVAIIYDANQVVVEQGNIDPNNPGVIKDLIFNHFVMRRTATRDILQVNFITLAENERIVTVVNHWPSRSGGASESEGYRMIAGETLAYFHERVMEMYSNDTPVIAMGDFNDEPFNVSLVQYALSLRSKTKVSNAKNSCFYNLMWDILEEANGSFYFDNLPNMLDQFLVNKNLIKKDSKVSVKENTVKINKFPIMESNGKYPSPIPYGGMGKAINPNGFSDHFPISVEIEVK